MSKNSANVIVVVVLVLMVGIFISFEIYLKAEIQKRDIELQLSQEETKRLEITNRQPPDTLK